MNNYIKFFINQIKTQRKEVFKFIIFSTISSILGGITIMAIFPLLSIIGENTSISFPYFDLVVNNIKKMDFSRQIIFILIGYILLISIKAYSNRRETILSNQITQKVGLNLKSDFYSNLLYSDWQTLSNIRKSDVVHSFNIDIYQLSNSINTSLRLFSSWSISIIQLIVALYISPKISLLILILGLMILLLINNTFINTKKLALQYRDISKKFQSHLLDQLNGLKETRIFNNELNEINDFKNINLVLFKNSLNKIDNQTRPDFIYKVISSIVISVIFYISIIVFKSDYLTLMVLVIIFTRLWSIFTKIISDIQNLIGLIPQLSNFEQLKNKLLQNKQLLINNFLEFKNNFAGIELENINFRYENGNFSLKNISIEIAENKFTAIIGESGSGKSTLIEIIIGLLNPTSGKIKIQLENITQKEDYLSKIAYISQDSTLFNSTIKENFLKFHDNISDDEMFEVLRQVNLHKLIESLPLGIDTIIGERGINLSGGERQRLILARVLLRKPSILILDEATSSLDNQNESLIQNLVNTLNNKITIIAIAHRLSSIKNADFVYVIREGEVIEGDSYSLLSKNKNSYLYKMLNI